MEFVLVPEPRLGLFEPLLIALALEVGVRDVLYVRGQVDEAKSFDVVGDAERVAEGIRRFWRHLPAAEEAVEYERLVAGEFQLTGDPTSLWTKVPGLGQ